MSLFLTVAALFATLPGHAPRAAAKAPPKVEVATEQTPRVEIGPAVLYIYDETGKVIAVE
ncbi:MAG: hypothetical protein ACXWUG_05480 [Polyangiales bacterium]